MSLRTFVAGAAAQARTGVGPAQDGGPVQDLAVADGAELGQGVIGLLRKLLQLVQQPLGGRRRRAGSGAGRGHDVGGGRTTTRAMDGLEQWNGGERVMEEMGLMGEVEVRWAMLRSDGGGGGAARLGDSMSAGPRARAMSLPRWFASARLSSPATLASSDIQDLPILT